jgi:hypothetical protein
MMSPHMLEELKAYIKTQIAQITGELLHMVSTDFIKSLHWCRRSSV